MFTTEYEYQASIEAVTESPAQEQDQTVNFLDQNNGETAGIASSFAQIDSGDKSRNVELQEFLSRPVRIGTITWDETDAIGTISTLTPWYLFFNDARIQRKLFNYAFIRCNLKVKILINASPFYYGSMICTYNPLPTWNSNRIITDANNGHLIPYSQRPHLWILPQENQAGTMTLPFFSPRNYLRTAIGNDFLNFGTLSFINYTALQSANGATGQGVKIQVFAWAEDVELSGPTVGNLLQADIEKVRPSKVVEEILPLVPKSFDDLTKYDRPSPIMTRYVLQSNYKKDGVISGTASAVASVARRLTTIPFISKFAKATDIGASALSDIAGLFGYTNAPIIEYAKPVKISAFPPLASPDISYPVEKLTLDPENELTIDPTTTGISSTDELSISYLSQRPSYLTTINFADSDLADDILFSSWVTPMLFQCVNLVTAPVQKVLQMTPMANLAMMYGNWRGSIKYKFKFICSKYHKARVRITYDPYGTSDGVNNIVDTAANTPVAFTEIVDIADDTEFEITVPYMQSTSWLRTQRVQPYVISPSEVNWSTSKTPTFSVNDIAYNGFLTVRVLTNLTAPVAGTSIQALVSVQGGDDFELANPIAPPPNMSYFVYQADIAKDSIGNQVNMNSGETSSDVANRNLVYFGEKVVSLRQLLRRSHKNQDLYLPKDVATDVSYYVLRQSRFPRYYGFDTNGFEQAGGILTATTGSTFQFNYTFTSAYHLLAPCFGGQRGSMIWHFNPFNDNGLISDAFIERRPDTNLTASIGHARSTAVHGTGFTGFMWTNRAAASGSGGLSATNQNTNSVISVLVPPTNRFKFQSTVPAAMTSPTLDDDLRYEGMNYSFTYAPGNQSNTNNAIIYPKNTGYTTYYSIGTDFNLFFFLNVPSWYVLSGVPVAKGTF
jgi:hypothetical protein